MRGGSGPEFAARSVRELGSLSSCEEKGKTGLPGHMETFPHPAA